MPFLSSTMKHGSSNECSLLAYRNRVRASGVANSSTLSVGEGDGKDLSKNLRRSVFLSMVLKVLSGVQEKNGTGLATGQSRHSGIDEVFDDQNRRSIAPRENLSESVRRRFVMAGAYFAITIVESLRGLEGLLVDFGGLRKT